MATSPEVSQDLCLERMRSLAGRMLGGGATCILVAWRIGSQYDFVAHGLIAQGDIVVAVRPDEDCMLPTLPAGVGIMVRVDLVRHSHDVMLLVIAASVRLLGELVLLPNAAVAHPLAEGQFPERTTELVRISGTRVGPVVMDRTLVYDHGGVTPIPREDLADARAEGTKAWCGDFEVYDVVASWGCPALRQVCRAVIEGRIPGQASLRPSAPGLCGHVFDKAFCTDVDRPGITLMYVGGRKTAMVPAGFEAPPSTLSALTAQVVRLVDDSEPVHPQWCIRWLALRTTQAPLGAGSEPLYFQTWQLCGSLRGSAGLVGGADVVNHGDAGGAVEQVLVVGAFETLTGAGATTGGGRATTGIEGDGSDAGQDAIDGDREGGVALVIESAGGGAAGLDGSSGGHFQDLSSAVHLTGNTLRLFPTPRR